MPIREEMKVEAADPPAGSRPLLPPAPAASSPEETHRELRDLHRFHRHPAGGEAALEGFRPALLQALHEASGHGEYPVFLGPPEASEGSSCLTLGGLLRRAVAAAGEEAAILTDHLPALEREVRRHAGGSEPLDARELVEAAGRALVAALDEAADGDLAAALDGLLAAVPAAGRLWPRSDRAPLHLLAQVARRRLEPARAAFREEARALAVRARALIDADRHNLPESREAEAVGGALGQLGSRFLDPAALSGVIDERPGGTALPAARRERLAEALAALQEFLADTEPGPLVLVHDAGHGIAGCDELPAAEWKVEVAEDPCAAAAELFDREAEKVARLRRAVRRVRLETEGAFDAERHEPWLERFDWQAFSPDELLLLTPVVALAAADQVAGAGMVSLSRLLRSGRPVQVLVTVRPAANPGSDGAGTAAGALSEYRFEPAYLGLSHREALVQQTSSARPVHLLRGFDRALAATHAGLHVISPQNDELRDAAALAGRAHPLFRYDPEAGATWADRFDFSDNPQPAEDWPLYHLEVRRQDGGEETLDLAFTFADFALLEPDLRHHFRPVGGAVPESETVALEEHCRRPSDEEDHRIPFLWGVDGGSRLHRLAVSQPLALACRDRLDFWRTLQELAGVRSEYARRAAAAAQREAEERARGEIAELEARHAEELERLRREAVEEAVGRITAAILEVDPASLVGPGSGLPDAGAPAAAAPFAGFQGRSVDEVAAELLRLVDPATLDREAEAPGDERVAQIASELGRLVARD